MPSTRTRGKGQLEVESREIQGFSITSLSPTSPFAFAIARDGSFWAEPQERDRHGDLLQTTKPNRRFCPTQGRTTFPQAGTFLMRRPPKRFGLLCRAQPVTHRVARLAWRNKKSVGESERELGIILSLIGGVPRRIRVQHDYRRRFASRIEMLGLRSALQEEPRLDAS